MKRLLRQQWDRVGAWGCVGLGVVLLVIGWLGVSGNAYPAAQLPYIISAGIGGLFVLGVGAMLWISADLRDEWQKLNRIEGVLRDLAGHDAVAARSPAGGDTGVTARGGEVVPVGSPAPVLGRAAARPLRSVKRHAG